MKASKMMSNQKSRAMKKQSRIVLSIFLVAFPLFVFSQNKAAEKANELFKLEQYTPAATYYEEAIKELEKKGRSTRSLLNLRTKLAFCYRVNNRMEKAEATYAEVVKEDRAKSQTYFYFGETLMANGKYEEAKKWFSEYQKLEPEDEKAALMIKACDEVQFIEPYFEYIEVDSFEHNSTADDNAAVIWEDGIVFSSDRSTDRKINVNILEEKSGWTGRDYLDIYFSKKKEDGTYSEPKQFSNKLSELNKNTGNTSFTLDGSEVFFTRNDNVLNKQKTYNLQLFYAENENGKWKNGKKLPFCSPNYNFMHPTISPDGKMLFFVTDKGGGQGGTDIWMSIREEGEKWSKPENIGPSINTNANEGFPFMDNLGRLYFCSKGHVGYGGFDIFFTEMTGAGLWKKPVNLGQPINSPLDDVSIYINGDRREGMFSSSRKGGDDDIFLFKVLDSPPTVIENNSELNKELIVEKKKEEINAQPEKNKIKNTLKIGAPEIEDEIVEENTLDENIKEITTPLDDEIILIEKEAEEITDEVQNDKKEVTAFTPEKNAVEINKNTLDKNIEKKLEPIKNEEILAEEIKEEPIEREIPEMKITVKEGVENQLEINKNTSNPELEEELTTDDIISVPEIPANEPVPILVEDNIETTDTVVIKKTRVFKQEVNGETINANNNINDEQKKETVKKAAVQLSPFYEFIEKAEKGELEEGERFRVDNAIFDDNIFQLTPNISKKLDELISVLRRYPSLNVELSAHTESMGEDSKNLHLSEQRAEKAKQYMIREGIPTERLNAVGYGETQVLNHCENNIPCEKEEHLFNQRLEIKILTWGRKQ